MGAESHKIGSGRVEHFNGGAGIEIGHVQLVFGDGYGQEGIEVLWFNTGLANGTFQLKVRPQYHDSLSVTAHDHVEIIVIVDG